MKEESEKAGLKLSIQNTNHGMQSQHFMSNGWGNNEETMETMTDFIFLGSKITADGDCSHEIKICLFLGRKAMANLDNLLRSRDISLPRKACIVKTMFFSSIHVWL